MNALNRCLAAGVAALLLLAGKAHGQLFFTDTTIDAGDTNYDGADIVVFGCTLTVNGAHDFSGVLVTGGGTLTHSICTNGVLGSDVAGGLNLTIENNLVVDAGASIVANGLNEIGSGAGGSVETNYPFGGKNEYWSGGGGGHGGFGGASLGDAAGGDVYGAWGEVTNFEMGSSGGAGYAAGGAGGGLIRLTVGGVALVDGAIAANGGEGTNIGAGGGSGGSIWISAEALAGSGLIEARGGPGQGNVGGGGAGGRVVAVCGTNGYSGAFSAAGGGGAVAGGAGTVYLTSSAASSLMVDNGGLTGTNTPVTLTNGLNFQVSGGAVAAVLPFNPQLSSLWVGSNSWVTLGDQPIVLSLSVARDATIQRGGGLTMDRRAPVTGLNAGRVGTNGVAGGGGNFGNGGGPGAGGSNPVTGNYGAGSSGASAIVKPSQGGRGGGVVQLTVGRTLRLDGTLSANGGNGSGETAGGGSGGQVTVSAATLAGTGLLSAVGGDAAPPKSGGGGGGEIIVTISRTNEFAGRWDARGGNGPFPGGAGAVVVTGPGLDQMSIDNGGLAGAQTPVRTFPLSSTALSLRIAGGAAALFTNGESLSNLVVGAGSVLQINSQITASQWNLSGNVEVDAGGAISLDAVSSSSVGAGQSGFGGNFLAGGGGGNGGDGGSSVSGGLGGGHEGLYNQALTVGGRGGAGSFQVAGGLGGGAVSFHISKNLLLNGVMSANGGDGPGAASGGGAGGSLNINAQGFSGSGTLSVNGGNGDPAGGGGGGAGRIAVACVSNSFTGTMTAFGGEGFVPGGAGTVYVSSGKLPGKLIIDNGGVLGAPTVVEGIPAQGNPGLDFSVTGGAYAQLGYPGQVNLREFVIGTNSLLSYATNNQPSNMRIIVTDSALIAAGGSISLDGDGFRGNTGSGAGRETSVSNILSSSGGGNAGYGGASAYGVSGGNALASFPGEAAPGCGGGGTNGGAGGGVLSLTVASNLDVEGVISANGLRGLGSTTGGGGAGGSLTLSARIFFGDGVIAANGGPGRLNYDGGGGGGEIIVEAKSNYFAGTITAFGGAGAGYGGAGVIFSESTATQESPINALVDNGGPRGTNTPLNLPALAALTVAHGGVATLNSQASIQSLLLASNGFIAPPVNGLLFLTVRGSAVIQSGGGIVADGVSLQGVGRGTTHVGNNDLVAGSGGGHGGFGGVSSTGAAGGGTYDNPVYPALSGSPGGGGGEGLVLPGGLGGGLVNLLVMGTLEVDGTISVNGGRGVALASGGGSGGGLRLQAQSLQGHGVIAANGGAGNLAYGGGGAGGCILIQAQSNTFAGTLSAYGGGGFSAGGAGTIVLSPKNAGMNLAGTLIIDNGGLEGAGTGLTQALGIVPNLNLRGGASLSLDGPQLAFGDVFIGSNSFWRPAQTGVLNLHATSLTIQKGGGIDFDAAPGTAFPGAVTIGSSLLCGSGGGNGGCGGASGSGWSGGAPNGSILQPASRGGTSGYDALPGVFSLGGGVIELDVKGTASIDGVVSCNGGSGTNGQAGGGAGGSIWLTSVGLSGQGALVANGGAGQLPYGGGGGGGRIAVYYTSNQFGGTMSARGGDGFAAGGAGTAYVQRGAAQNPNATMDLTLDNGGLRGTNTPLTWVSTNVPISQRQLLSASNTSLHITGGATAVPAFSNAPELTLVAQSLLIDGNATLTQTPGIGNVEFSIASDAVVAADGSIDVDGKGYPGGGVSAGSGLWGEAGGGGGGGYGGAGGPSVFGGAGGAAYGSSNAPIDFGGGGGLPELTEGYSDGGGAIQLKVAGTLVVDGMVSANGQAAEFAGAGGGAGGSVFLASGTLAGRGVISANGGAGATGAGGGGGGGRLAIYYLTNDFTGTMAATGGEGDLAGANGTVVLSTNSAPAPLLVLPAELGLTTQPGTSGGGQLTLRWAGVNELTYQLESSTNLIDWTPCGAPLAGSNGVMTISAECEGEAKFFRVVSRN